MSDENNSQLNLFVQESRNRVKLCLDDFDTLAQDAPEKRSMAFDRLLRTIRGIGGSARFHALSQIVRLCHSLESFLGRFRAHLLNARPEFVSVVVLAMKKLGQLLSDPLLAPPLSIDQELLAIQSMLAAHADPPEFNLADYPQALAAAVTQGLDFYSLHIPLGGDQDTNRNQFLQIKAAVEVVTTLIAAKPDLGRQFEWRDDLPGGVVRLLLSTVLPGEILHGLIQLPQERIVRLEIPEALSQAVTVEVERLAKEAAEARAQTEAQDEDDCLAETQLGEVEEQTRLMELDAHKPEDPLDETQLGDAEFQARQRHFEEMQRQAVLQERQRQQANDEAEQNRNRLEQARRQAEEQLRQEEVAQAAARSQQASRSRRRWLFGGMAAAGLLVVVAQQANIVSLPGPLAQFLSPPSVSKKSIGQVVPSVKETPTAKPSPVIEGTPTAKPADFPPKEPSAVATSIVAKTTPVPSAPSPTAVPPPKEPPVTPVASVSSPPAPSASSPEVKEPPAATPPAVPVVTAPTPSPPPPTAKDLPAVSSPSKESTTVASPDPTENRKGEPIPFSPLMLEQNNLPNVDVKAAELASRSSLPSVPVKPEAQSEPKSWKNEFARLDVLMVRLTKESYDKFKPARNTKHGSLRVWRNQDGDMVFSVSDMMGHEAMRQGDRFKMTPDSMAELRLVFQVERGHAYMFELNRNGEAVIPKEFWTGFSKVSKLAVSLSRVMKKSPEGLHLRDLTALTTSYILRTTAP
ncbi:MAG: Hpt domain-containing protein [Magnetococcales bacterium]|nr:Hpt domain-containing protein [Magnetococcales bacterium]